MLKSGDNVMLCNGPGTAKEPAILVNKLKDAHPKDPLGVEVWEVIYVSDTSIIQIRGVTP